MTEERADVVVIGAGIVGAMAAFFSAKSGLKTLVIDRGAVASGTTGAGEGNIMVSDKSPGPELELALLSRDLWFEVGEEVGNSFELVAKGGLAVARKDPKTLYEFADSQKKAGVAAERVEGKELLSLEPHMNPNISFGVHITGN